MSYYGVVLGGALIVIFAGLTILTYNCVNDLIVKSGKKSYANLCAFYFGKRNGRFVGQFLIFAQFCSCVIYPSVGKPQNIYS